MRFVKLHGLGNDYLYLDAHTDPALERRRDLPSLARAMSDRHFGAGADGIILVCRPTPAAAARGAAVRMRMFNADGSESQMCGNGVRGVAKFAHDRLRLRSQPLLVETGRGLLAIDARAKAGRVVAATVDMGPPILDLDSIPVAEPHLAWHGVRHQHGLEASGHKLLASFVSMGNPHLVVFNRPDSLTRELTTSDLDRLDLHHLGPILENHPAFPQRINVHFVAVESPTAARMRTWERGSGITLACGTGACAVLVAGVRTGRLARKARITLPGGPLDIRWPDDDAPVFMTGPTQEVYEGDWPDAPARAPARAATRAQARAQTRAKPARRSRAKAR